MVMTPLGPRSALGFWHPYTGELNRKYLRVASTYRLLKRRHIGKERALKLLAEVHTPAEMKTLRGTVELWKAHPIKDMLP